MFDKTTSRMCIALKRGGAEKILEVVLEKRKGEIADLKSKAKEAESKAHTLKTQAGESQRSFRTEESAVKKKLEEELDAKIVGLERRLGEREGLLEKRNGEIADLKSKAKEAERKVHTLKTQAEESRRSFRTEESAVKKKLEEELVAKVTEFEQRLGEREGLLEKRNGEIADLKSKAKEAEKQGHALKAQLQKDRQRFEAKGSNDKHSADERLKNKIPSLEKQVKDLEGQVKNKEDLLRLMAKRNWELADLKSKVEERVEILEAQFKGDQQTLQTEESGTSQFTPHQKQKPSKKADPAIMAHMSRGIFKAQ